MKAKKIIRKPRNIKVKQANKISSKTSKKSNRLTYSHRSHKVKSSGHNTFMSIVFNEEYRNKIGCKITLRFSEAIRDGEIPDEEIEEVANFVLSALKAIESANELMDFLDKLTHRWPCFANIQESENSQQTTVNNIENSLIRRTVSN
jgi:hypothetical protein